MKTVDNGCTEEEAMAAAAKAGELMDKYGIESSEVEIRAEKCQTGAHKSRAGKHGDRERSTGTSEVSMVATAIAEFCQCRVWRVPSNAEICYFGLPHDVEIAQYMTDSIETAMRSSFRKWRKGPERPRDVSGHRLRGQYMNSMASRLSDRLDEMTRARTAQHHETSDGKSLVAVKSAVVEEQYAELGMKLKKPRDGTYHYDGRAAAAGRAAADAHKFNSGVGQRTAGLIERG